MEAAAPPSPFEPAPIETSPRSLFAFGPLPVESPPRSRERTAQLLLASAAGGYRARRGGGFLAVQRLLQDLAGLEVQDAPLRDDDRIAGLRISPLPLPLVAEDEIAEAGDLDLFPAPERFLHHFEGEIDEIGRFLLRKSAEPAVDDLDDVGFGHGERVIAILRP